MTHANIVERRPPSVPAKLTIRLDHDTEALLRHTASEWNLTQGETVTLALQVFAGCGALTASQISFAGDWQARLEQAMARARTP